MEELIELQREVKALIEAREGFTGNNEALLDLDFESIRKYIEDLEELMAVHEGVMDEIDDIIEDTEVGYEEALELIKLQSDKFWNAEA